MSFHDLDKLHRTVNQTEPTQVEEGEGFGAFRVAIVAAIICIIVLVCIGFKFDKPVNDNPTVQLQQTEQKKPSMIPLATHYWFFVMRR